MDDALFYRLIDRVEKDEHGCWIWQGAKKGVGLKSYGHLTIGSRTDGTRRTISAHRAMYVAAFHEIPDGLFVCHSCDVPSCINPAHLFLGSRQDNVDDREGKSRNKPYSFGKHEDHPSAKLKWSDVEAIRSTTPYRGYIKALALEYEVNHKTISDIVNNKTWIPEPPL